MENTGRVEREDQNEGMRYTSTAGSHQLGFCTDERGLEQKAMGDVCSTSPRQKARDAVLTRSTSVDRPRAPDLKGHDTFGVDPVIVDAIEHPVWLGGVIVIFASCNQETTTKSSGGGEDRSRITGRASGFDAIWGASSA